MMMKNIKKYSAKDVCDYAEVYHATKKAEEKLRQIQQTFDMWHRIDACVEIIKQLHGIYYPPSGKYYEFEDGTTCEDWDLESTIRRKLVEIDHIKKEKNETQIHSTYR